MNIMDYLDMRGDLTFAERPFNEVDNLIFSELAYLDMNGIVDDSIDFTVTIAELCEKYLALGYDQSYIINDPKPRRKKAAETARFKDIRVGAYVALWAGGRISISAISPKRRGSPKRRRISTALPDTPTIPCGWAVIPRVAILPCMRRLSARKRSGATG